MARCTDDSLDEPVTWEALCTVVHGWLVRPSAHRL